jgi:hypothetical protein
MTNPLAEATASLLGILQPLSSEERHRVVQAVLVLLGDEASEATAAKATREKSALRTTLSCNPRQTLGSKSTGYRWPQSGGSST